MEGVKPIQLRFERQTFYIVASILAWVVFWQLADAHAQSPHAQLIAWFIVLVAVWVAENY